METRLFIDTEKTYLSFLKVKGSRSSILRQPRIGKIVLLKDENLPCWMWKMALIKEFYFSKDGDICLVIIQLPSKQLVSRAINHLIPLKI